jgi:hypothetical protein
LVVVRVIEVVGQTSTTLAEYSLHVAQLLRARLISQSLSQSFGELGIFFAPDIVFVTFSHKAPS